MRALRITIFVACLWLLINSCFRRFSMSDKEIRRHYAHMKVKPTYFTIKNDSVQLFCATTGTDTLPPLLLIHGAPGAWYTGMGILDDTDLQKKYQIIAVDRPGYNNSMFNGKKKAVTSISTQAVAIHEAMRLNRSHSKGILYGTSYGAPIAAEMALMYPNEFDHLLMVGGAIDPDNEKFWWFHKYVRGTVVRFFLPRFMNTATDEKFAHVAELKKLLPRWREVNIPVTVLHGSADEIVPVANFQFAKKQFEGKPSEFILIPGAGHLVRRSHPEIIKEVLMQLEDPGHMKATMKPIEGK